MKYCNKCKTEKEYSEFFKFKHSKDGYGSECKICSRIRVANWLAQNKDRNKFRLIKYKEVNKEILSQKRRNYRKKNKDKVDNKIKEWRIENDNKVKEYNKKYYRNHKHIYNAQDSRRRCRELLACVTWRDENKIKEIYEQSRKLSMETGIQHHVDHIVPLQGKLVCGLHWEGNLQILTQSDNCRKGAKFDGTNC